VEEPALGLSRTDGARLAACHRFRIGRRRGTSEKEGGRGLRPCEEPKSSGLVARTSYCLLQKSVGDVWPQIGSANALQKERSGSSERRSSPSCSLSGEPTAGVKCETTNRTSASPLETGEDRRKAQDGERSSSSGRNIAKAVRRSRDRGRNGHRILRRVPTGGRHPGSSRSAGFHETASTVVLALCRIPRPVPSLRREGRTARLQHSRR
jgi:hypothetical protein